MGAKSMVLEALGISFLMMLASGFSAVTGFGTSTISIPILLFFFPLPQTLLFVGIMRLVATLWKMFLFKDNVYWKLIIIMGVPATFSSIFGAKVLLNYSDYISRRLIGFLLFVYVLFVFFRPHFRISKKSIAAAVCGSLSGLSAGVTGIGGPIQAAFLSMFHFKKVTYIFTVAVLDSLVDISRLTTYLLGGVTLIPVFLLGLVFSIPAIFVGAFVARKIVYVIPEAYFRFIVVLFLGVIAFWWMIWG